MQEAHILSLFSSVVYSGDWVSDASTGCQVWSWSPNSSEESIRWWGKCLEGKATGKGVLQWLLNGKPNGQCQEIEYSEGKRVKGICRSAEGIYEGDFADDKKTGKGVQTLPNGDIYEGDFVDGKAHGFIRFSRKNSEISTGLFEDGILVKQFFNCSSQVECLENEKRENKKREIEEQQETARLKREEKERQAKLNRESNLSPQAMYLQAGKYDRNGQKYDAIRLYEILVDKYPDNSLAIQATNRLVAMQADEEAASRLRSETNRVINEANRQQSQSSAECRRRKEAYANSCGSDSYCYTRARSICSE